MFTFYEVGGKVRDELLGLSSKDIDYVAVPDFTKIEGYTAEMLFNTLCSHLFLRKYELFLITPDKYTVRAKFPKDHIHAGIVADFVMARKEIGYIEGTRDPVVIPGTLEDDLARRDFTVNAIAKDEKGNYIDPFNGRGDLEKRILRTPIEGQITFDDDPLRLLRAIRFAITKDFTISEEIQEFILDYDYENKFSIISEERIREELYKCFNHDTLGTIEILEDFPDLRWYIFTKTKLWLKPTNEK